MQQSERLNYLIHYLLNENREIQNIEVPNNIKEQKLLLRGLMNIRMPKSVSQEFLVIQDEYLQEELKQKGTTDVSTLQQIQPNLYLWRGDITTLRCDAIVNAANSKMLGCFIPCHGCIDNAIHSAAGVQLRMECADIMKHQQSDEPTGEAKITKAYNLPCCYVLHTVGPIIHRGVTKQDEKLLAACYLSCLQLAERYEIHSLAFCCISTGEFHFPNRRAAEIAIDTVKNYQSTTGNNIKVIFNVFKEIDYNIYRELLGGNKKG